MEITWQERLAEILAKEPAACTPSEIEFLQARRSYISADQAVRYAEVLSPEEESKETEAENPPEKKAKK